MSGRAKRPSASADESQARALVLATAKKALARGDAWDCEPAHYDRLRADCDALGVLGNEAAITIALRDAIAEITIDHMRQRADPSYAGLASDQALYECRWDSARFKRRMYFKFAINDGRVEVFTFHEDVPRGQR